MGDLISRSELLKTFNDKNIQITFDLPVEEVLGEDVDLDDFTMLVQDAIQAYKKMVIDTIKKQPTAYDIDKTIYDKAIKDCSVISSKLIKCQECPVNCNFGTEESCAEDLRSYFMKQLNGNENIKNEKVKEKKYEL